MDIAIEQENNPAILKLLAHGADIKQISEANLAALKRIAADDIPVLRTFRIDRSEEATSLGTTPLHLAAAAGDDKLVKLLMKQNAHLSARDENYKTPLHLALENGHISICLCMLTEAVKTGEILNIQTFCDARGKTLLHLAAEQGDAHAIRQILKVALEVEEERNYYEEFLTQVDYKGMTAMQYAAKANGRGAVDELLAGHDYKKVRSQEKEEEREYVAQIIRADEQHSKPPVFYAIESHNAAAVQALFEEAKKRSSEDDYVKQLLTSTAQNSDEFLYRPIDQAAAIGNEDIFNFLLERIEEAYPEPGAVEKFLGSSPNSDLTLLQFTLARGHINIANVILGKLGTTYQLTGLDKQCAAAGLMEVVGRNNVEEMKAILNFLGGETIAKAALENAMMYSIVKSPELDSPIPKLVLTELNREQTKQVGSVQEWLEQNPKTAYDIFCNLLHFNDVATGRISEVFERLKPQYKEPGCLNKYISLVFEHGSLGMLDEILELVGEGDVLEYRDAMGMRALDRAISAGNSALVSDIITRMSVEKVLYVDVDGTLLGNEPHPSGKHSLAALNRELIHQLHRKKSEGCEVSIVSNGWVPEELYPFFVQIQTHLANAVSEKDPRIFLQALKDFEVGGRKMLSSRDIIELLGQNGLLAEKYQRDYDKDGPNAYKLADLPDKLGAEPLEKEISEWINPGALADYQRTVDELLDIMETGIHYLRVWKDSPDLEKNIRLGFRKAKGCHFYRDEEGQASIAKTDATLEEHTIMHITSGVHEFEVFGNSTSDDALASKFSELTDLWYLETLDPNYRKTHFASIDGGYHIGWETRRHAEVTNKWDGVFALPQWVRHYAQALEASVVNKPGVSEQFCSIFMNFLKDEFQEDLEALNVSGPMQIFPPSAWDIVRKDKVKNAFKRAQETMLQIHGEDAFPPLLLEGGSDNAMLWDENSDPTLLGAIEDENARHAVLEARLAYLAQKQFDVLTNANRLRQYNPLLLEILDKFQETAPSEYEAFSKDFLYSDEVKKPNDLVAYAQENGLYLQLMQRVKNTLDDEEHKPIINRAANMVNKKLLPQSLCSYKIPSKTEDIKVDIDHLHIATSFLQTVDALEEDISEMNEASLAGALEQLGTAIGSVKEQLPAGSIAPRITPQEQAKALIDRVIQVAGIETTVRVFAEQLKATVDDQTSPLTYAREKTKALIKYANESRAFRVIERAKKILLDVNGEKVMTTDKALAERLQALQLGNVVEQQDIFARLYEMPPLAVDQVMALYVCLGEGEEQEDEEKLLTALHIYEKSLFNSLCGDLEVSEEELGNISGGLLAGESAGIEKLNESIKALYKLCNSKRRGADQRDVVEYRKQVEQEVLIRRIRGSNTIDHPDAKKLFFTVYELTKAKGFEGLQGPVAKFLDNFDFSDRKLFAEVSGLLYDAHRVVFEGGKIGVADRVASVQALLESLQGWNSKNAREKSKVKLNWVRNVVGTPLSAYQDGSLGFVYKYFDQLLGREEAAIELDIPDWTPSSFIDDLIQQQKAHFIRLEQEVLTDDARMIGLFQDILWEILKQKERKSEQKDSQNFNVALEEAASALFGLYSTIAEIEDAGIRDDRFKQLGPLVDKFAIAKTTKALDKVVDSVETLKIGIESAEALQDVEKFSYSRSCFPFNRNKRSIVKL